MTDALLHLELHYANSAELQRAAARERLARTARAAAAAAAPGRGRVPVVRPRPALPR